MRTIVGFAVGALLMGTVALLTGWKPVDTVAGGHPRDARAQVFDGLDRSRVRLADALDIASTALADLDARTDTLERLVRQLEGHSSRLQQWANHLRSRRAGDCPAQPTIASIRRILFRARVAVDETHPEHPPFAGSTAAGPALDDADTELVMLAARAALACGDR